MTTPLQKNLRQQILEKKISVHALEKKAGLKPSAIHNILQGRSKRPAAEVLIAVAQELGCSVEDLVREDAPLSISEASTQKWSPNLYMSCCQVVQDILDKKKIALEKKDVLEIIEEVYRYSAQGNVQNADKKFADWLVSYRFPLKSPS